MRKLQALVLAMGILGCQENITPRYDPSKKDGFEYVVDENGRKYSFKVGWFGSGIAEKLVIDLSNLDDLMVSSTDYNHDGQLDHIYYNDDALKLKVDIFPRSVHDLHYNGNMNLKEIEQIYRMASQTYTDFKIRHQIDEQISAYDPENFMRVKQF